MSYVSCILGMPFIAAGFLWSWMSRWFHVGTVVERKLTE